MIGLDFREKVCLWLFTVTDKPYAALFKRKRKPWKMNIEDLGKLKPGTWGKELYNFMTKHGFKMLPKLENHDAYHVLLKMGIEVKDEVGMQYLLFGNGKRTPYLFSTMIVGTALVPDHFKYYKKLYQRGKALPKLYHLKVEALLKIELKTLQEDLRLAPPSSS